MKSRKHDIEKYLQGELSPAEMHALEKEALNDPFLAEALEGMEQAGADNFLDDLHRLNRKVHERTRHRKDKTIKIWGWTTGMAAAVLLVAVSGFVVISLLNDERAKEQAMNKEPAVSESAAVADSATDDSNADSARQTEKPQADEPQETPAQNNQPIASLERAETQSSVPQTAADERLVERESPVEGKDDVKKDTVSLPDLPDEVVDQNPITLAEIPDADVAKKMETTKDSEAISEALQGRVAGVRSKTGAVTRSSDVSVLRGRVTSATDGEGLPGVNVIVKGTDIGAVTDAEGNYELRLPDENNTLVFSYIGFEALEAKPGDNLELNIALQEDVASLSEVVVSGYGSSTDHSGETATFHAAEPVGGKSNFQDYLSRTIKYPDEALRNKTEGRVTVRFTVEPNGQLTNFEVSKGIGSGCDEELIRAIKEGPRWTPGSRGDEPMADKVKVRFKFELPE